MKRIHLFILLLTSILIIAGCGDQPYEKAMGKGQSALEDKDYSSAITYFKEALDEEPEDDEAAETLLTQTETMITAIDAFEAGDLDKARENYTDVIEITDGSDVLQAEAEEQLADSEEIAQVYDDITEQYKTAKKLGKDKKFAEAFKQIEKSLKNDIDHPAITPIKDDVTALEKDLEKKEEKVKQERAAEKKRRAEEQEQAEANQKQVDKYVGYWLSEDKTMACHFTESMFACAVAFSDVIFNEPVKSVTGNANDDSVSVTFSTNETDTYHFEGDNILMLHDGPYTRVTKDEANAIYEGYFELP